MKRLENPMDARSSLSPPILVTGGTGTLGRHVVDRLRSRGLPVRVLSRGRHPIQPSDGVEFVTADLSTGAGVGPAVAGVDTVIHLAGSQRGDDVKARHLVEAAKAAGVDHLVLISVVGVDRIQMAGRIDRSAFGYFGSKRAAELVSQESGLRWTILRATQFFDLTLATVAGLSKLPIVPVPGGFRFQPVDSDEVAARLVELALGTPTGLVPDLGGPRTWAFADLVRTYLRATGRRRLLVAAALRAGANLAPDRAVGRRTWEEFVAASVDGHAGEMKGQVAPK
jgi:uncharacterized protein YbjT (DUF2867 family)